MKAEEYYPIWAKKNPHNAGNAIQFAEAYAKELIGKDFSNDLDYESWATVQDHLLKQIK